MECGLTFLEAIYTWADLGLHTPFSLHLYYDPALVTTDPGTRTTGVLYCFSLYLYQISYLYQVFLVFPRRSVTITIVPIVMSSP